VRIFDVNGRLTRQEQLPAFSESTSIDIDGLKSGFYMVEWHTEQGVQTRKLLLE